MPATSISAIAATGSSASCRRARRRLFWLHNPARYLRKPRNVWRLAWYRPTLVVTGRLSCAERAGLAAARRSVKSSHTACSTAFAGPPRASRRRPARSLPRTRCAGSIGCSICGYRGSLRRCRGPNCTSMPARRFTAASAPGGRDQMEAVLARADSLAALGVRRFHPVGREALAAVLAGARAMLYRGDPGETFCLALAEAQAMGVPAVVHAAGLGRRADRRWRHRMRCRGRGRLCRGGGRRAAR